MSHHELRIVEGFGRCVFSSRPIEKGTVVAKCELLVLSEEDTKLVNITALEYYTFKYNERQDCIVLGDGSMFNHNETPNVSYELQDWGDRKVMLFIALEDIPAGVQLFTDYTQDSNVDVTEYLSNKSLI